MLFITCVPCIVAYDMAKRIIHLACKVGEKINVDPDTKDLLTLYFLPDYNVSVAETIIPGRVNLNVGFECVKQVYSSILHVGYIKQAGASYYSSSGSPVKGNVCVCVAALEAFSNW